MMDSSRTLKSIRMCCHNVLTDATLNCSKLLDVDGSPDNITTSSGWMLLTEERLHSREARSDKILGSDFSELEST
jgi:hypothetical protein